MEKTAKTMSQTQGVRFYLLALGCVLMFFGLIFLYTREFTVFSNTLHVGRLVAGAMITALLLSGGLIWRYRSRFTPWETHLTEVLFITIFSVAFAPLIGSLLNRALGKTANQSFEFVSEIPYIGTGYGFIKGETLQPTGYYLTVREGGKRYKFRYKSQRYYPITQPGEQVLLPVRTGLFGIRVVRLQ